jgi:hypothetical protein
MGQMSMYGEQDIVQPVTGAFTTGFREEMEFVVGSS